MTQNSDLEMTDCAQNPALFSSQYMEKFDITSWREENPDYSKKDLREAKVQHKKNSALAVGEAKKICAACPLLEQCAKTALRKPPGTVFGVVGGMTREERVKFHGRSDITYAEIFANATGDDVSATAALLVKNYS